MGLDCYISLFPPFFFFRPIPKSFPSGRFRISYELVCQSWNRWVLFTAGAAAAATKDDDLRLTFHFPGLRVVYGIKSPLFPPPSQHSTKSVRYCLIHKFSPGTIVSWRFMSLEICPSVARFFLLKSLLFVVDILLLFFFLVKVINTNLQYNYRTVVGLT